MGRHRHLINVRADGLSAVLEPFAGLRQVRVAALIDAGSGMLLDGFAVDADAASMELLAATHAEFARITATWADAEDEGGGERELTVSVDGAAHHLLRTLPDPHGDQLVLSVLVRGSARRVGRVWRELRAVSVDALTAGPSAARRPVNGRWAGLATSPGSTGPGPTDDPVSPVARPAEPPARPRPPEAVRSVSSSPTPPAAMPHRPSTS